jgi:hypothetical protein
MEKAVTVTGGALMGAAVLAVFLPVWMLLLGGGGLLYVGSKMGSDE